MEVVRKDDMIPTSKQYSTGTGRLLSKALFFHSVLPGSSAVFACDRGKIVHKCLPRGEKLRGPRSNIYAGNADIICRVVVFSCIEDDTMVNGKVVPAS